MTARRLLYTTILAFGFVSGACDDDAANVGDGSDADTDAFTADMGDSRDGGQFEPDGGEDPDDGIPPPDGGGDKDAEVLPDQGEDPDDGVLPPDEGIDPDDGVLPPDEGVPPDEGIDPDDGVLPPDEGVDPPDEGVDPPDDGVDPPDEGVDPPDEGVDPPDEGIDPPDQGMCFDCDGDGVNGEDGDCDDENPLVFPGAPELCDNLDNNCDGVVDGIVEECYTGPDGTQGQGVCRAGQQTCLMGEFGACEGEVVAGEEVCGDEADGDCDGIVDEGCDEDGDGFTIAAGDCRDDDPAINPDADEVCDNVDNDCDGVTDGNTEPCYQGPNGTEGQGVCVAGERVCVAGEFEACDGQVLPAPQDACGNEQDDDCDGEADENCNVDACPDIDLNSRVYVTADCLAARATGAALVVVDLRDADGNPVADIDLDITVSPNARLSPLRVADDLRFKLFTAPSRAGTYTFSASVGCEDGNRLALNSTPEIVLVPGVTPGSDLVTGGCSEIQGNLRVTTVDANTGLPIGGAWVMAGLADANSYQTDGQNALRGRAGNGRNIARSGNNGAARLRDFGGTLVGPQTVTVGAEGYENVTLTGVNASDLVVPLRPVAPPAPDLATINGQLTQFNNLRPDEELDVGLVVGSFDLPFLAQLNIPRLLSRSECWDPVAEGFVGGFVDAVPVPGNLYVPEQSELVFGVNVTIEEHRFALSDLPAGTDNILGIAGKVPSQQVVDILVGGGSLDQLLELLELGEIGAALDQNVAGNVADLSVPMREDLVANARCTVDNVPAGADLACVSAGDWSGANGTGRLFPMGLLNIPADTVDDMRGDPIVLPVTTVAPERNFVNIGYLGAIVALYAGQDDGDLDNAVSAVLDRDSLSPQGGNMVVSDFFTPPVVSRDQLTISWDPVGNANAPDVDVCRVEVVRTIQDVYDPGACTAQNFVKSREEPVWTGYIGTDTGELQFPIVPNDWPRGDIAGLVAPGDTPERDFLTLRVTCMGLGLAQDFDFDAANFRALIDGLTHVTVNSIRF